MNFGEALAALKEGKRVARAGWNGKGMWLVLVRSDEHGADYGVGFAVFVPPVPRSKLLPWIGMKTADDFFVPWLASQTDMLSEDWEIAAT